MFFGVYNNMKEKIIFDNLDGFLRDAKGVFSIQTIYKFFHSLNIDPSDAEILSYLKSHPLVFQISNNSYITRASVFTKKFFSIKPTKAEIAHGILIPGHRCLPFVDPDIYPHEQFFSYNKKPFDKKIINLPLSEVMEVCFLYGEEYIPQLFSADPANNTFDFSENNYAIPNNIDITVFDLQELYSDLDFQYGDRFLANVVDWDMGVIDIQAQKTLRSTPFEVTADDESREQWFRNLDEALLHTLSNYGPLSSIEEQLAYTFYTHSALLCTELCCSIEEYMELDKSVCIEYYGVESRLWKKGEEIPAVGAWNDGQRDLDDLVNTLYEEIGIPIPFYMLDAYIFDALYRKEKGFSGIFDRIIPDKTTLDEIQIKTFMLHIQERYDKLVSKYNRFLDFEKGQVRSSSLELYSSLVKLICELDSCGIPVASLPQQQLVIVSQLFSHTTKFLEAFMTESNLSKEDIAMISTSLDGMLESFDEVSEDLTLAMGKKNVDGFTII